jgi:hypothetical protein
MAGSPTGRIFERRTLANAVSSAAGHVHVGVLSPAFALPASLRSATFRPCLPPGRQPRVGVSAMSSERASSFPAVGPPDPRSAYCSMRT